MWAVLWDDVGSATGVGADNSNGSRRGQQQWESSQAQYKPSTG